MRPEVRAAIRRLDVKWMHRHNEQLTGAPFTAAISKVNGKMYSADEVALLSLHKLRTTVGTRTQRRASTAWLRQEGLLGLFDSPLRDN